jgi:hypothetical protein
MALRGGDLLRSRGRWLGGIAARAAIEPDAAHYRVTLGAPPQTFERIFQEAVEGFGPKEVE